MSPPSEKSLDLALAAELEANPVFLDWFVAKTKFSGCRVKFVSCRSNHPWGTHPFPAEDLVTGAIQTTQRQSETDVLLIVTDEANRIIGLHIENKVGSGKFTSAQPEMYQHRAEHWIRNARYGNYSEFDTVLLAPLAFRSRHESQAGCFGCFIAHEEVAKFIPLFGHQGVSPEDTE